MKDGLVIGIDASNLKAGGGVTHLKGLISNTSPEKFNIKKIIVWGGDNIKNLPEKDWLVKDYQPELNGSFFKESWWKLFKLSKLAKANCDLLFCPGSTQPRGNMPYVSMSRNMLVFEKEERARFPWSWTRIRYHLLERIQGSSFKNANANIFISEYAQQYISKLLPKLKEKDSKVIYHGCSPSFRLEPRPQKSIQDYSKENPFKILYVSIINFYKHQWNVVEGLNRLYEEGVPIELHLVGPAKKDAFPLLEKALEKSNDFVKYHGAISHDQIAEQYKNADMFLYASSCENMPNILVESMYAGLPIACSDYGPMPEILKDGGLYFDPLKSEEIYTTTKKMIDNPELRFDLAQKAYQRSMNFSWEKCSDETFKFLSEVAKKLNHESA